VIVNNNEIKLYIKKSLFLIFYANIIFKLFYALFFIITFLRKKEFSYTCTENLLSPVNEGIGVQLLMNMGWKPGDFHFFIIITIIIIIFIAIVITYNFQINILTNSFENKIIIKT
jgi:hypothetical protein